MSWGAARGRRAGDGGPAGGASGAPRGGPRRGPGRGDPMSPLRWTTKSTRNLADELTRQGHKVGADTVGDLLRAEGFSLQGNAKTLEGTRHPDRDAQFRYISGQVQAHQDSGDPVISVDTKKKELIGEVSNAGRDWRPKGQPTPVRPGRGIPRHTAPRGRARAPEPATARPR